ncbi:MAG: BON domain-containing protein [Gammaproteobacteria bacterium]
MATRAIYVDTFKGTVQLSGFAKSSHERQQAEQVARSVAGVEAVKNDISVNSSNEFSKRYREKLSLARQDRRHRP